jgi:hypothetical protein
VVTYSGPSATGIDNCDPAPTITSEPPLPATFGIIGDYDIVFSATDFSGNASICTMTVTVLPTSYCLKQEAIPLLKALVPTGNRHLDKEIDKVIWHIRKSLSADLWIDVKRLGCKHGHKVFNEEKTAIVILMKEMTKKKFPAELVADFQTTMSMLLDADDVLAQTQLDEAIRCGGREKQIEKARAQLIEARSKRVGNDHIHALDDFRKGWKEACKAMQEPEGGGIQVAIGREPRPELRLLQNQPNPFCNNTTISFALPLAGNVTLTVYDASGRLVATLFSGEMSRGIHSVMWDAVDAECGVYFCRLTCNEQRVTRKMIILR